MASVASPTGLFEPVHDAHAIEHVVIAIQFHSPLSDASIVRAQQACAVLSEALPAKNEVRTFGMTLGPHGMSPLPSTGGPDGFVLSRIAANGAVEKEFRLDRNGITFRTSAYTRWVKVWGEARQYLATAVAGLGEANAGLDAYSLHYVDKFIWRGDTTLCRPARVLKVDSKYIAGDVFAAEDLWHSHMGIFSRVDDRTKRLLAVNADCVDEPVGDAQTRIVRIGTLVTEMLNQPSYEPSDVRTEDTIRFLDDKIADLHNLQKVVFAHIVTGDVAKRIDLTVPS